MKIIITEEQLKKILKIKSTLNEATLSMPVPYRGVNSPFQKKRCLRWGKNVDLITVQIIQQIQEQTLRNCGR